MVRTRGFTLIELLITLAIIGILFTVAVPAYQGQMERSRRSDAKATLLNIAARQEKFMAQRNSYTTDVTTNAGLNLGTAESPEGFYTITVAACATGTIASCYLITATARGTQADDSDCTKLTLDSTGWKAALKSDAGPSSECW